MNCTPLDICLAVMCVFFPPLAVLIKTNISMDLGINILLTIFFWIPGVLHAFYVCFFKGGAAILSTGGGPSTTTK